MTKRSLAFAALVMLTNVRCQSEPPAVGIVVEVTSDMSLQELDAFRILVTDATGKHAIDRAYELVPSAKAGGFVDLPFALALYPDPNGTRPVKVDVTGFKSGAPRVWRRATLPFAPGQVVVLPMPLLRSCLDNQCDETTTCVGLNMCATRDVDVGSLERYTPGRWTHGEDAGSGQDAAPAPDAGSPAPKDAPTTDAAPADSGGPDTTAAAACSAGARLCAETCLANALCCADGDCAGRLCGRDRQCVSQTAPVIINQAMSTSLGPVLLAPSPGGVTSIVRDQSGVRAQLFVTQHAPDGQPLGERVAVTGDTLFGGQALVFGGDRVGLTWVDSMGGKNDVHFRTLAAGPSGFVLGEPLRLSNSTMRAVDPAIAWSGSQFAVVWTEDDTLLRWARLDGQGQLLQPATTLPAGPPDVSALLWDGARWALAVGMDPNGLSFMAMTASGQVAVAPVSLAAPGGVRPLLARLGTGYLVTYRNISNQSLWFMRLDEQGRAPAGAIALSAPGSSAAEGSLTAVDGTRVAAVWLDTRSGSAQVYLRWIGPNTASADQTLSQSAGLVQGPRAVFDGTALLVTWLEIDGANRRNMLVRLLPPG